MVSFYELESTKLHVVFVNHLYENLRYNTLIKIMGVLLSPASRYKLPTKYYYGDQIKEDEMGEACGTFGWVQKYINGIDG